MGTHVSAVATARPVKGIRVYRDAGTSAAASASPSVVEKRKLCAVPPVPSPCAGLGLGLRPGLGLGWVRLRVVARFDVMIRVTGWG